MEDPDSTSNEPLKPSKRKVVAIVTLQVHHDMYFTDKLPWEYETKYLRTLCTECHALLHRSDDTPVYRGDSPLPSRRQSQMCEVCDGVGRVPYHDEDDGICDACGGRGFMRD